MTRRARAIMPMVATVLLLAGCGAADTGKPSPPEENQAGTSAESEAPSTQTPPEYMPDVTGMKFDEARASLIEYNATVSRKDEIDTATPGTVIDQDPADGAPFSSDITLTVSTAPPDVPDATSQSFVDAAAELRELGFQVIEEPVFDSGRADGYVLEQDPPPGTGNQGTVTLHVARSPVTTYLSELDKVASESMFESEETGEISGEIYGHAITLDPNYDNGYVEYNLSRQYRVLTGDIGISDSSPSECVAKVEFLGDDRSLGEGIYKLRLGEVVPLKLEVQNDLRLRISVTAPEDCEVVLGDIRVEGLESEIRSSPTPTE